MGYKISPYSHYISWAIRLLTFFSNHPFSVLTFSYNINPMGNFGRVFFAHSVDLLRGVDDVYKRENRNERTILAACYKGIRILVTL